jgi:CopG antitoxin of type II toxin-antitoxin system
MPEDKRKLPKFRSIDELVEFFDENDSAPYWNDMPEVHFDIDLKRRAFYFEIESDLAEQINEISRKEHAPSGAVLNSLLRERLSDHSNKQ